MCVCVCVCVVVVAVVVVAVAVVVVVVVVVFVFCFEQVDRGKQNKIRASVSTQPARSVGCLYAVLQLFSSSYLRHGFVASTSKRSKSK